MGSPRMRTASAQGRKADAPQGKCTFGACAGMRAPATATTRGECTCGACAGLRAPAPACAGLRAPAPACAGLRAPAPACAGLRGFRNHTQFGYDHTQFGYDLANCRTSTPTRISRDAREIRSRSALWLANASSAVRPIQIFRPSCPIPMRSRPPTLSGACRRASGG
jgi:hypothetical protein